jgi:hypothetical protein
VSPLRSSAQEVRVRGRARVRVRLRARARARDWDWVRVRREALGALEGGEVLMILDPLVSERALGARRGSA